MKSVSRAWKRRRGYEGIESRVLCSPSTWSCNPWMRRAIRRSGEKRLRQDGVKEGTEGILEVCMGGGVESYFDEIPEEEHPHDPFRVLRNDQGSG